MKARSNSVNMVTPGLVWLMLRDSPKHGLASGIEV
jgi:hypothetical protein